MFGVIPANIGAVQPNACACLMPFYEDTAARGGQGSCVEIELTHVCLLTWCVASGQGRRTEGGETVEQLIAQARQGSEWTGDYYMDLIVPAKQAKERNPGSKLETRL